MMLNRIWKIVFLFALGVSLMQCGNESTAEKIENDVDEAGESVTDAFRTEREELKADLRDLRDEISDEIEEVKEDMQDATGDAKGELQGRLNRLEMWGKNVDDKIDNVGDDIADGWQDFKRNAESSINEIKKDLEIE